MNMIMGEDLSLFVKFTSLSYPPFRCRMQVKNAAEGIQGFGCRQDVDHNVRPGRSNYKNIYEQASDSVITIAEKIASINPGNVHDGLHTILGTSSDLKSSFTTKRDSKKSRPKANGYGKRLPKWKKVNSKFGPEAFKDRPKVMLVAKDLSDDEIIDRSVSFAIKHKLKFTSLEFTILYRRVKGDKGKKSLMSSKVLSLISELEHANLIEILIRAPVGMRNLTYSELAKYTKGTASEEQIVKYKSLVSHQLMSF